MRYNPGVHHRQSVRIPGYDYRGAGLYFVTICTFERACVLVGPAAVAHLERTWRAVGKYNHSARGEDFVVMPNHIHGIIRITRPDSVAVTTVPVAVGAQHVSQQTSARNRMSISRSSHRSDKDVLRPYVLPGSLGAFVRAFKSASAKRINTLRGASSVGDAPVWQRGYHERIIRDEAHLAAARQYILDNPAKWDADPNNPATAAAPYPYGRNTSATK